MPYKGSCHCGAIEFRVQVEKPTSAMDCNCSHCRRKGFLLSMAPASAFSLVKGSEALTEYKFYKHAIAHRFCATCGVQAFGIGKTPDGNEMVAINLRCVPDIDLDKLSIEKVDGASL